MILEFRYASLCVPHMKHRYETVYLSLPRGYVLPAKGVTDPSINMNNDR
jgi:hypothetical protein